MGIVADICKISDLIEKFVEERRRGQTGSTDQVLFEELIDTIYVDFTPIAFELAETYEKLQMDLFEIDYPMPRIGDFCDEQGRTIEVSLAA